MAIPVVLLYSITSGTADAADQSTANGIHPVEKTFQLNCGIQLPGSDPVLLPAPATIKTNVPDSIAPGKQFQLTNTTVIVQAPFDTRGSDTPVSLDIEDPNFKIVSENQTKTVRTFGPSKITVTMPPNTTGYPLKITDDKGVNVGSFTAGEEGKVTLKLDDIRMTALLPLTPDNVIPVSYFCEIPEGTDTTIETIPIDSEAPKITLNGDDKVTVNVGDKYEDQGATAKDNIDGDLTDQIKTSGEVNTDKPGEYTITYTVLDNAGNEATAKRTVMVVDNVKPEITLNGDNPMKIEKGDPFKDPGAKATDNVDGDLTDQIKTSGNVDNDKLGEYKLTYFVKDSSGNEATTTRIVNVVEPNGTWFNGDGAPDADLGSNGDLYLDNTTGDVYNKKGTTWEKVMNIKGAQGPKGEKGDQGDKGDKGDPGEQGPIGKSGSMWYTDEGTPSADLGQEGDLYLNTKNDDVYKKTSDGWEKITSLKGAKGSKGSDGNCDCHKDNNKGHKDQNNNHQDNNNSGTMMNNGNDNNNGGGMNNGNTDNNNGTNSTTNGTHTRNNSGQGGLLPVTASRIPSLILVGLFMAMIGGVLLIRKKKFAMRINEKNDF